MNTLFRICPDNCEKEIKFFPEFSLLIRRGVDLISICFSFN